MAFWWFGYGTCWCFESGLDIIHQEGSGVIVTAVWKCNVTDAAVDAPDELLISTDATDEAFEVENGGCGAAGELLIVNTRQVVTTLSVLLLVSEGLVRILLQLLGGYSKCDVGLTAADFLS